jgi:hypothetical protein
MSLAPMADLDPKGAGGKSMPGNKSCPVVRGGAVGVRVLGRRLDCLKPNLQEDGRSQSAREDAWNRRGLCGTQRIQRPQTLGARSDAQ